MFTLIVVVFWILCAFLSAAIVLGHCHAIFHKIVASDRSMAWGISLLFGPIALIAALIVSGFGIDGLKFW